MVHDGFASGDDRLAFYRPRAWYSTRHLGILLEISEASVRALCKRGGLPCRRWPGKSPRRFYVVDHEPFKRWLRSQPDFAPVLSRVLWAEQLAARFRVPANPPNGGPRATDRDK